MYLSVFRLLYRRTYKQPKPREPVVAELLRRVPESQSVLERKLGLGSRV